MENVKYNDLKKRPPALKPGQRVVYELVNIRDNPMAYGRQEPEFPFMLGIPYRDRIIEQDGERTEVKDIAYIVGYKAGNKPIFGRINFTKANAGAVVVNGSNANDQKLYEYLELCNFNQSNPNRNPSIPALFKRRNYAEELKKKSDLRKDLKSALDYIEKMSAVEMRKFALGLNVSGEDDEEIRMKVEDWAEKNPRKFLAMTENQDLVIMEVAEAARKAKLITIDNQGRRILNQSGSTITTWPPEVGADWKQKFVGYVKTQEGQEFYRELKEIVKIKK